MDRGNHDTMRNTLRQTLAVFALLLSLPAFALAANGPLESLKRMSPEGPVEGPTMILGIAAPGQSPLTQDVSPRAAAQTLTSEPEIDFEVPDWDACLTWLGFDITVLVDGEEFEFDPSCGFNFTESFTTKKGIDCEVEAGMCTSWDPEGRFEVECDGVREGISIVCKDSTDDGISIEPDWDDCVDGWLSMDITVTVGEESFDFNPSCSFSFSDSIQTEAGGLCEIESGMCSDWEPKESFEVTCEKGQEASVTIPCKN